MNRLLVSILFFSLVRMAGAAGIKDDKRYTLLTFRQIELGSPWLQSGNAAGLAQMPELFPSEVKLTADRSSGDFHSAFGGKTNRCFDFSSASYRKVDRTFLYGSFNYGKSLEKGINYSNTNRPAMNYPYLLADTIGKDTYDREFFKLKGILASPINAKFDWGLDVDYQVGVAAQNRDPRTENKVMMGNVSPGLLYKQNKLKLGLNLTYGYYNEDIDVSVVQEGAQQTMFQMHGLGMFAYHASNSFFRLYRQQQFGGGMQVEYKNGLISNVLYSDYLYFQQTVDDGRKGSNATWAAVKKDAKLDGIDWNLTDVFAIDEGRKLHQLRAEFGLTNKLGTEFIQRLEKVDETDLEHWRTYGEEQKYYSLQTRAGLNYLLMGRDENKRMKSLFQAGVAYSTFDERYYLPNLEVRYANLAVQSSFLKQFAFAQSNFVAEIKFKYQRNTDQKQNMDATNFMVRKIYLPEFSYLTQNYFSPGFSAGYQFPVKKFGAVFFVKTDFDWYRSVNGLNFSFLKVSTGIIF